MEPNTNDYIFNAKRSIGSDGLSKCVKREELSDGQSYGYMYIYSIYIFIDKFSYLPLPPPTVTHLAIDA